MKNNSIKSIGDHSYHNKNEFFKRANSSKQNTKGYIHNWAGISSQSVILLPNPNRPFSSIRVIAIKQLLTEEYSFPHRLKQEEYLNWHYIEEPVVDHTHVGICPDECIQKTTTHYYYHNQVHIRRVIVTDTLLVVVRLYSHEYCIYWNYYQLQNNQSDCEMLLVFIGRSLYHFIN